MRFIARCYKFLKRYDEANMWLLKAIDEAPYLRDPYIEMALLKYELNDFNEVYKYINLALKIKEHQKTYINEVFSWNETPYDLLSIACYYLDKYDEALEAVNHALEFAPYDERMLKNKELIIDKINEKES
jgi:tetratricopeptide (TPR) repeat protein